MATTYETLIYSKEGPTAILTINRPQALNALNSKVLTELYDAVMAIEQDHYVRSVIITGAGEKAFVAGADIAEMQGMGVREALTFASGGQALGDAIEGSGKPYLAAVNGFALGGGLELALACDFIYASQNAKLGQPEVNLGVIPGFGGTQRLTRRVGAGRARELIFTGDMVTADEALKIGLVNVVTEQAELLKRTKATADKIAQKGPVAVAEAKKVILRGESMSLDAALSLEAHTFGGLFDTADQKEGMKAFLEKRPPKFEGR